MMLGCKVVLSDLTMKKPVKLIIAIFILAFFVGGFQNWRTPSRKE